MQYQPSLPNPIPTRCTGLIVLLVGPAGVGKNTIMQDVLAALPMMRQLPTATTRPIRPGEQEGIHHFFVTVERFRAMIAAQELLEYQEVDPGRFYGVVRAPLQQALTERGELLIADIEVNGAAALRAELPDQTLLIFINPPSFEVLETRLRGRGNMDEAEIQTRLARAKREMLFADQCDHQVVNHEREQASQTVLGLIRSAAIARGCLS